MSAELHLYEIIEAEAVYHWVIAESEADALVVVDEVAEIEEPDELEVFPIKDDEPWDVAYVDGFDTEDPASEVPATAKIDTDGEYPVVTALAREWATWAGRCYFGCSEF